jgi:hypothetical protein
MLYTVILFLIEKINLLRCYNFIALNYNEEIQIF